jgi:hypothetical protein
MLPKDLRELQLRDINVAISVAILAATINSLWVIREIYDTHLMIERASAGGATICFAPDFHLMFVRIVIALLTSLILLSSRKMIGLCFSAFALLWILLEYFYWYVWSQNLLETSGRETFPEGMQHALGMSGATAWNAALLAIVSTLFIWELKTIIKALSLAGRDEKL